MDMATTIAIPSKTQICQRNEHLRIPSIKTMLLPHVKLRGRKGASDRSEHQGHAKESDEPKADTGIVR
ncbi:hypothetical protein [Novipirellula artificiosorum]|uniref:hypothetical protein n=1 Tax=Novipirellula artificiosorum TaxID=2528016 RepID=UPI0018CC94A9|nr:hypothetical protein [Novipirellula artificiosorum]